MDAPADALNAMAGRPGRIEDVSAKTMYSKN